MITTISCQKYTGSFDPVEWFYLKKWTLSRSLMVKAKVKALNLVTLLACLLGVDFGTHIAIARVRMELWSNHRSSTTMFAMRTCFMKLWHSITMSQLDSGRKVSARRSFKDYIWWFNYPIADDRELSMGQLNWLAHGITLWIFIAFFITMKIYRFPFAGTRTIISSIRIYGSAV